MFPLSDDNPTTNYPAVNHLLIGFNIIAFIAEFIFLSQGGSIDGKLPFDNFALVPARFVSHFSPNEFGTIFSSMFMHAGFSHIIGNLWFLYIFGDNVEDRMGSTNYLLFYLTCGIFADLAHILTNPLSAVGCVGASGAISGVLGAYLVLYPGVKVHTWITWYWRPRVDAWILIGLWFFSQVVYSLISSSEGGGTAWFAHIGGFVCGIMLLKIVIKNDPGGRPAAGDKLALPPFISAAIALWGLISIVFFAYHKYIDSHHPRTVAAPVAAPPVKIAVPAGRPVVVAKKTSHKLKSPPSGAKALPVKHHSSHKGR